MANGNGFGPLGQQGVLQVIPPAAYEAQGLPRTQVLLGLSRLLRQLRDREVLGRHDVRPV